jgi:Domain of unknown function (DUF5658)
MPAKERQNCQDFGRKCLLGLPGLRDLAGGIPGAAKAIGADPTEYFLRRIWQDATVQLFIYFQALDLVTTLLGLKLGASEASPFICVLMHAGPFLGLFLSKSVALGLGGACLYLKKRHLLRWVSYWYAGLVMWNLLVILAALGRING